MSELHCGSICNTRPMSELNCEVFRKARPMSEQDCETSAVAPGSKESLPRAFSAPLPPPESPSAARTAAFLGKPEPSRHPRAPPTPPPSHPRTLPPTLTTQAQRPGIQDATIATATLTPGSLQRMVRPRHVELLTSSAAQEASSFSRLCACQSPSCALAIRADLCAKISCISDGLHCAKCESKNHNPRLGDQIVPS